MTLNQANLLDTLIQKLAKENKNIEEAFQQMKYEHEDGILYVQKNINGKNVLTTTLVDAQIC